MSLEVKTNFGTALKKLSKASGLKAQVMPLVYAEFVKNTPVKTGNARRNTTLRGNNVEAKYGYAKVLDDGRSFRDGQMRGSTQAPQGMSKPTLAYMTKLIKDFIKQKVGK